MNKKTITIAAVILTVFNSIAQDVATYAGKAYDGSGKYQLTKLAKESFEFSNPKNIMFDKNNRMYVSNEHNICVLYDGVTIDVRAGSANDPNTTYGHLDGLSKNTFYAAPNGMIANGNNDVFIADFGNNVIRKLSKFGALGVPQTSSTIAGAANKSGFANGAAASARFDGPSDIAQDSKGVMYIADENNHCIRTLTGGKVATVAGVGTKFGDIDGAAASAKFDSPQGLFFVDDDHLLICDSRNGKIKELNLKTMVVKTIVSGLTSPSDVAMVNGEMYIADGRAIMKWASNKLTTYAGSTLMSGNVNGTLAASRFGNISGMYYRASDKKLYVVDMQYNVIKTVVTKSSGVGISTVNTISANVYPNPANNAIMFSTVNNTLINSASIIDMQGKIIKSFNSDAINNNTLDVADIQSGIYFLSLNHVDGIIRKKIVIQK